MYKEKLILGVLPVKRFFLSMETAKEQKDAFMRVIRNNNPDIVEIVDVDDICENGIAFDTSDIGKVVAKFQLKQIDALFIPFCDFGEEVVSAGIASQFHVPVLVWGARDERPNTTEARGRDTQCGMFAATKVLMRYGVKYSYIHNVKADSEEFCNGYLNFLRTAAVLKTLKNLRIAKIGERPFPFMSVMTDEASLLTRFGIVTYPIAPSDIADMAKQMIADDDAELRSYIADLKSRMDTSKMVEGDVAKVAALKIATQKLMQQNNCSVGAMECWSIFGKLMGFSPCLTLGELADVGLPISCETDINGAVTMAIARACTLFESAVFLADLTIRHPQNDNAELLWHCGPFPYSLKSSGSPARLVEGQEQFELRKGDLTLIRFDDCGGQYYLFAGEGKTTSGPETIGTYTWLEVDNLKRWEEKLMFGPYIHHIGGMYGKYLPVMREVARYLCIHFDNAHEQGTYSL